MITGNIHRGISLVANCTRMLVGEVLLDGESPGSSGVKRVREEKVKKCTKLGNWYVN